MKRLYLFLILSFLISVPVYADTTTLDALPALAAPSDDDITWFMDDPASAKTDSKTTWAQIKSTLKTYFDSLYTGNGIVMTDSTPDANGEIGYASNAYSWFANSEDFTLTASANTWTASSSTGVTSLVLSGMGITASNFTAAKSSGVAGDQGLYEANSTDTDAAGWRGPDAMTGDTSYRLKLPTAKPATADSFIVWATTADSGDGTPASPYTVTGTYKILGQLTSSDDPDVSTAGRISHDTDGWLRLYDGGLSAQVAIARQQEEIHVTVVKPNDMADAVRDAFMIWSNESGMSFIVTGWKGWSGTDDTTLNIEEAGADGVSNNATVDAVELATGSGPYTGSDTTITGATIENGHVLLLDFDDTDDPSYVKLVIYGYYGADVN